MNAKIKNKNFLKQEYFKPYGNVLGQINGAITTVDSTSWCNANSKIPISISTNGNVETGIICTKSLSNTPLVLLSNKNGLQENTINLPAASPQAATSSLFLFGHFMESQAVSIAYTSDNGLVFIYGCARTDINAPITCSSSNINILASSYKVIDYNGDGVDDLLYQTSDGVFLTINQATSTTGAYFAPPTSIVLPQVWQDNFANIQKANFTYTPMSDLYLQANGISYALLQENGQFITSSLDYSGMLNLKNQGPQWHSDCWKVTTGDFDGNGITDFAAFGYGEYSIMLNDDRKFGDTPIFASYKIDNYPYSGALACVLGKADANIDVFDLNGDGKDDIMCYNATLGLSNAFVSNTRLVDNNRYSVNSEISTITINSITEEVNPKSLKFYSGKFTNAGSIPIRSEITLKSQFKIGNTIRLSDNILNQNLHKIKEFKLSFNVSLIDSGLYNNNYIDAISKINNIVSDEITNILYDWQHYDEKRVFQAEIGGKQCPIATHTITAQGYKVVNFSALGQIQIVDNYNNVEIIGSTLINLLNALTSLNIELHPENDNVAEFIIGGVIRIPTGIDSNVLLTSDCNIPGTGILLGISTENDISSIVYL